MERSQVMRIGAPEKQVGVVFLNYYFMLYINTPLLKLAKIIGC